MTGRSRRAGLLVLFLTLQIPCGSAFLSAIATNLKQHAKTMQSFEIQLPSFEANNSNKDPPRIQEISRTVTNDIIIPILHSIQQQGWDIESLWSRPDPSGGDSTIAERVTNAVQELGPTYVKFGQALASRPDIIPKDLATALSVLQDDMEPFSTAVAKEVIKQELRGAEVTPSGIQSILDSIGDEPVAAASIGQVYRGYVPQFGEVAIKVQRPGIKRIVERDAELLLGLASWVESIPGLPGGKSKTLIAAKLVDAVEEFMTRLFEELDYRREVKNIETFASLYSNRYGSSKSVKVVVPDVLKPLCSERIIVMQWIDGTKLANDKDNADQVSENLALVKDCIECTLSQLLETGVLHSDPHDGNLLKIKSDRGKIELGYLDFGILSTVPEQVRDALVCSVVELVFNEDVGAVAELFGELQLLSPQVLNEPDELRALTSALDTTFAKCLEYPEVESGDVETTPVPELRFDALLAALSVLVARFEFKLPPYFLNNARALGTLEGIARKLDPEFNVLRVMYPFALNRLLRNPSGGEVVTRTLLRCITRPGTDHYDMDRIDKILRDSAAISGHSRLRVLADILRTKAGWRITRGIAAQSASRRRGQSSSANNKSRRIARDFLRL